MDDVKTNEEARLCDLDDVARRLLVSRETVKRFIRAGRLRAVKLSARSFRVEERELQRFLDAART